LVKGSESSEIVSTTDSDKRINPKYLTGDTKKTARKTRVPETRAMAENCRVVALANQPIGNKPERFHSLG
jgi:hypothetical protein